MKLISFLLFFSMPVFLKAQVTHSISFSAGLSNVFYKSDIKESRNFVSLILPTTIIDYNKHNDNSFWGGAGVGFNLRHIPYHVYPNRQKVGAEAVEFWFRARAGLKFEGEKSSQLPYLSLGLSFYSNNGTFSKNGIDEYTYSAQIDSGFNDFDYFPFIEIGSKFIKTSFKEDRGNVSTTLAIRYYPSPVFTKAVQFEYDYNKTKSIQYHMIELVLILGFQFNVHR